MSTRLFARAVARPRPLPALIALALAGCGCAGIELGPTKEEADGHRTAQAADRGPAAAPHSPPPPAGDPPALTLAGPAGPSPAPTPAASAPAPCREPQATTVAPPPRSEHAPAVDTAFRAAVGDDATSTFAVDVDTASLSHVRRHLRQRTLPPPEMVRLEELVNAFRWSDAAPGPESGPLASHVEVAACPWAPARRLVRVALRGADLDPARRPVSNLVFLVDVSGSMAWEPSRLPLVKRALHLLVDRLGERDGVSIVVYAGASGLVLPPTCAQESEKIHAAIDRLEGGGSTNGGAGIELAYATAVGAFVPGGVNRVVLCTDGDFNVGVQSARELEALIERKARTGVFLSVLGFGTSVTAGSDRRMEALADRGNGNYAWVDDLREARRVLHEEMLGTLVTIAKDVKVQVAWDPARVARWRLLGYDDRRLANRDFADDRKDAGDVGVGHSVVAYYEVELAPHALAGPLGTLRLRWKAPDGEASRLVERRLEDRGASFEEASADLRFGASIVAAGGLLRGTADAGTRWPAVLGWARAAKGDDPRGERTEWIELMEEAARLQAEPAPTAAATRG